MNESEQERGRRVDHDPILRNKKRETDIELALTFDVKYETDESGEILDYGVYLFGHDITANLEEDTLIYIYDTIEKLELNDISAV